MDGSSTRPEGSAAEADLRLAEGLRHGEPESLSALVDAYGSRIYGFASRMCRSREDAYDVMQDTFLAAVRSARDFRGEGKLSTWLFRIAANACRKMRRHGKFEPATHLSLDELVAEPPAGDAPGDTDTPEAALQRADLRDALESAIGDLPKPYRAVLVLRDVEGLSTEEVAEALDLSVPAVKTRLHRARLFVRQRLVGRA
jgi:RNA polymerase sigma-70 factor (ECF subfamily)